MMPSILVHLVSWFITKNTGEYVDIPNQGQLNEGGEVRDPIEGKKKRGEKAVVTSIERNILEEVWA